MKRTIFAVSLALSLAVTTAATAQCLFSFKHGSASIVTSPFKAHTSARDDGPSPNAQSNADISSITGLWHIQFLSGGQVVDEGFDQYHADGNEILNDTPPPAAGNICLGVWSKTGARSLKLKHPSWIYDPTNTFVIGTATILENVTIDHTGNSFTGTFTVQLRDLDGNPLGDDLTGQIQAERITPG